MVATKADLLKGEFSNLERPERVAKENGWMFIKTSAKEDTGVHEAFEQLVTHRIQKKGWNKFKREAYDNEESLPCSPFQKPEVVNEKMFNKFGSISESSKDCAETPILMPSGLLERRVEVTRKRRKSEFIYTEKMNKERTENRGILSRIIKMCCP